MMETILLIEDYTPIRENLVELLELEGYRVATANNGEDGLNLAISARPSLILCDIQMPVMDGYQVLEKLKENQDTKEIPFIYVTASCEKSEEKKAMDLGADGYLRKPFHDDQLLNLLSEVVVKEKPNIPQ